MDSTLQKLLAQAHNDNDRLRCYQQRSTDSTTAMQALAHLIQHHYNQLKNGCIYLYTVRAPKLSLTQRKRLYSIGSANGYDMLFILQDIESPTFWNTMQHYGANLDDVTNDEHFQTLVFYKIELSPIVQTLNIHTIEQYISTSLRYHTKDIQRAMYSLLQEAIISGLHKEQFLSLERPEYVLAIEQGMVELQNKQEVALYEKKLEYIHLTTVKLSPYFFFTNQGSHSYFIGKRAYKKAILSYTSPQARSLRFGKQGSHCTDADILIHEGMLQKIYIRGTQQDQDRWYDTTKEYPPHETDLTLNHFYESTSGLSEISHLVTQHQDLIFRASIHGTALVEGVSGSGKTNLIFHRIDYLLQEHPNHFNADAIGIITPNTILGAYMQHALDDSSFTFKDTVKISSLETMNLAVHNPSEYTIGHDHYPLIASLIHHTQSILQQTYTDSRQELIDSLLYELQTSKKDLIAYYTKLSKLDQHVHKQGYQKDVELFDMLLKKINGLENCNHTPAVGFKMIQDTISQNRTPVSAIYNQTVPQWYFGEFFEKTLDRMNQHMSTLQDQLLTYAKTNSLHSTYATIAGACSTHEKHLLDIWYSTICQTVLGMPSGFPLYDYVLLDEFQDFHPFVLHLLFTLYGDKMIMSGDFMQSAWYQSVNDLETLSINISDHKYMTDNFRNTLETIQYAHQVFEDQQSSLFLAKRVAKRGEKPLHLSTSTALKTCISNLGNMSNETVAYIYQNIESAMYITSILEASSIAYNYLTDTHSKQITAFHGNVKTFVLSYYQCKGLEFDHVVVLDKDFLLGSTLEYKAKLWYIGCTRAVKRLYVYNKTLN